MNFSDKEIELAKMFVDKMGTAGLQALHAAGLYARWQAIAGLLVIAAAIWWPFKLYTLAGPKEYRTALDKNDDGTVVLMSVLWLLSMIAVVTACVIFPTCVAAIASPEFAAMKAILGR